MKNVQFLNYNRTQVGCFGYDDINEAQSAAIDFLHELGEAYALNMDRSNDEEQQEYCAKVGRYGFVFNITAY